MSCSATISFKKIKAEDIPEFFRDIKAAVIENLDGIAEDDYLWSPFARKLFSWDFDNLNSAEDFKYSEFLREHSALVNETDAWIQRVFAYRWFYLKEMDLLGIYGLPNQVQSLFDLTQYFQNSCDQDYNFEDWKGIPEFEKIAQKWANKTDEEMLAIDPEYGQGESVDLDYYRRSLCYKEIWELIEDTLWDDRGALYLSLFGFYDDSPMRYRHMVLKKYVEWIVSFQNEERNKEKEKKE